MAVVLNDASRVIATRRRKTKGEVGANVGVARIVETIEEALGEAKVDPSRLSGIGMGVPGMLNLNTGLLKLAPNLGWRDVPLRKVLTRRFHVPVAIANDVDAGVYGEYRFGSARGARCVVGVFPGTGVGGGCVYEGRILRGKTGSCMEIGHVPVMPDGTLCGCGRRGCLETVASRLAISAELAQAVYRGEAPQLKKLAGTDIANIRSGIIREAMEAGDRVVERIVRHAARQIGRVLIGTVHQLAPDVIVLGGGLVEEMPALFVGEITDTLNKGVTETFRGSFKVAAARLGDYATAMGAAALASDLAGA
ncbi:Glucokinase (Glucose kinase) [sediment metagenome]|uniref:Glucokinase (Glucose kinase) n=1 Tax=sediment metagenome TaxID=749907 RepID=D9PN29_9ZZZZ